MAKIYTQNGIYLIRKNLSVFDYELEFQKKEEIKNVEIFGNNFIDIDGDKAKIFRKDELYFTMQLPKKVDKFIINDYFIFSFEGSVLTIISLIGNKIVFNANVAKSDIKKLILKGDLLFIQSENSIIVLDIIKKKIIFNLAINSLLFDTDGEKMVVYNENMIYKLDFNKNITKQAITISIDDLRISGEYIFVKKENNLYLFDEELTPISKNCECFDIKDNYIYSLENVIKKYNIDNLIKNDTIKFLTVDDSTTMRLIIKNAIMNNFDNVEVYEAKDGKKALEVLEENPDINVIFMDWNMPVMNGREAVIKIRENKEYDHIKIIMATTEGGKDKVSEMISYGVKGYLVKPLKPTSVVPVVEKMIELVKEERDV